MSSVYEFIGRAIVRLTWARYGRQISIAGGVFTALVLAAGFVLARRQPPEG